MTVLETFLVEVRAADIAIRQEVTDCEYCNGFLDPLCNNHQSVADFHTRTYVPTMARVIEVLMAMAPHEESCQYEYGGWDACDCVTGHDLATALDGK